jgi:hypothetical protein
MIGFRFAPLVQMRIIRLAATLARVLVSVALFLLRGRHALVPVKPETMPRRHREGFRFWCAAE